MECMAENQKPLNQRPLKKHTFAVDAREKLTATGIRRVIFCSDELITAETELGQFNMKGEALHIDTLSSETGDMLVIGKITAISYTESKSAASLFGRIFK